ncbi:MAG: fatty acid desaturase [Bacteroidota bacterium]
MNTEALKNYAKELRQRKYQSDVNRSLFHFFKFLAFVIVFFIAQFLVLKTDIGSVAYIAIAIVISFFHGLTYLSLWLIGHDCGHSAFSNNKKINQWVGSIATSFMLMNYENFKRSHNMHHNFVGNIERDEAFGPKAKRKDFLVQRIVRCIVLIPFLAYLLGILLPSLTKTPGYVNYFWPDKTKKSIQAFGFVVLQIVGLVLIASFLPFIYFTFVGIIPILVSWLFFLVTTFLNHTGEHTKWYPNKIWTYDKGVFNTINLSYGPVIDYFLIGLGRDHFAHHINPSIPHYKLKQATDYIGETHPNNRIVKGHFFKFIYYYYKYSIKRIFKGYFVDSNRPFTYKQTVEPKK